MHLCTRDVEAKLFELRFIQTRTLAGAHQVRLAADRRASLQVAAPVAHHQHLVQVHADLAAFAEYIIREERRGRGHSGESDTGYGELN